MRVVATLLFLVLWTSFSLADVVVNNIGITSTSVLMATNFNTVTFTPTQTGTFGTLFTIKVKNDTGATGDLSVLRLTFSGGIGLRNGSLVGGAGIAPGGYGEFQYNLGNISYTNLTPKSFTFDTTVWSSGTIINWATAATGTYEGAWGSGASASIPNGMYSVAVPEPGTLCLGGLLATGSGAGLWWSRRRKATATS